jgi:acyl-CoA thioester hydrolase
MWLEIGRGDLLRVNGLAYRDLEQAGIFFVIVDISVKFRRPARYDEPVKLETCCGRVTASRVEHTYRITDVSSDVLLTEGQTTLACVDEHGKLRRVPAFMRLAAS